MDKGKKFIVETEIENHIKESEKNKREQNKQRERKWKSE